VEEISIHVGCGMILLDAFSKVYSEIWGAKTRAERFEFAVCPDKKAHVNLRPRKVWLRRD
jgi:hypothetical protein